MIMIQLIPRILLIMWVAVTVESYTVITLLNILNHVYGYAVFVKMILQSVCDCLSFHTHLDKRIEWYVYCVVFGGNIWYYQQENIMIIISVIVIVAISTVLGSMHASPKHNRIWLCICCSIFLSIYCGPYSIPKFLYTTSFANNILIEQPMHSASKESRTVQLSYEK